MSSLRGLLKKDDKNSLFLRIAKKSDPDWMQSDSDWMQRHGS